MVLKGMLVNGYIVRSTTLDIDGEPLVYGVFDTVENASAWQEKMIIETTVEPVYAPVYNRG